jgi:hypothetical protein
VHALTALVLCRCYVFDSFFFFASGTNVEYFQANYSILVGLCLAYVSYHAHSVFWTMVLLGLLGFWLFNVRKNAIVVSGRVFSEREVLLAFAILAATVLFYVGDSFLLYSLAFAGLLILIHAGFKTASLEARATNVVSQ